LDFGSVEKILDNSLLLLYLFLYFIICMNMTLVYSIILDMTLLYLIMFSIILFLVYFDYMLGIVRLVLTLLNVNY
jgi:hypothetical protein